MVLALTAAVAHAQGEYPIMDKVAQKVISHYEGSSCEQLKAQKVQKAGSKDAKEQKAIQLLKDDPQMRQQFLNKVAGPIANKLFECGMIP